MKLAGEEQSCRQGGRSKMALKINCRACTAWLGLIQSSTQNWRAYLKLVASATSPGCCTAPQLRTNSERDLYAEYTTELVASPTPSPSTSSAMLGLLI